MTGVFTQHWIISIVVLLVLFLVSRTRQLAVYTFCSGVGLGLFMLFLLAFHNFPACNRLNNSLASWWIEISAAIGLILRYVPTVGTVIRGIVAIPVAWMGVIVWDLVWNLLENILVGLLSFVLADVADAVGIIGNTINVVIFMGAAAWIAGKAHLPVMLAASAFVLLLEWGMMHAELHTCSIVVTILGNDELNYWQWISFAISAVIVGGISWYEIATAKKQREINFPTSAISQYFRL